MVGGWRKEYWKGSQEPAFLLRDLVASNALPATHSLWWGKLHHRPYFRDSLVWTAWLCSSPPPKISWPVHREWSPEPFHRLVGPGTWRGLGPNRLFLSQMWATKYWEKKIVIQVGANVESFWYRTAYFRDNRHQNQLEFLLKCTCLGPISWFRIHGWHRWKGMFKKHSLLLTLRSPNHGYVVRLGKPRWAMGKLKLSGNKRREWAEALRRQTNIQHNLLV